MDITKMVDSIVTKIQIEINEKQKEIAIIETVDFTKFMDIKTWNKLCETTIFNELGNNNIATEIVKMIFPEAKNVYNTVNEVVFTIEGINCMLSTEGNGLQIDLSWYTKTQPDTFEEWLMHSHDYMVKNYINYVERYRKKEKPSVHDKIRLYKNNRYHGKSLWDYFIYIVNYKNINTTNDKILHDMTEFTKDAHEKYLIQSEKKNRELDKKITIFWTKVLPVLEKFSGNLQMQMEMEQKLREEGIVANKDKDVWKD